MTTTRRSRTRATRTAPGRSVPRAPLLATGWLLALAVVAEVSGTACLRASDGLTRAGPLLAALLAYAAATALLGRVFARGARVGAAYGVLTGCGLLGATLLSVVVWGEPLDGAQVLGVAALGVGVLMVQVGQR